MVEMFFPTWTGGFVKQCWFVTEFPKKKCASIVIRTENKVFGVLTGERCGCFWREILSILGGIDTSTHEESHSSHLLHGRRCQIQTNTDILDKLEYPT